MMMLAYDQMPRGISALRPIMFPLLFLLLLNRFGLSRLAAEWNFRRRPLLLTPELLFARIETERIILRQHVEPIREAKRLGGMRRPIRIAQHLARDRDDVGLALLEDRLGMRRLGNHADDYGGHAGFAAHMLGIVDVIARQIARHRRQARVSFEPATRHVEDIDAARFQLLG